MKIRHKITLWITGAGLLVSSVFSLIIFLEMKELPFNAVDAELRTIVQTISYSSLGGDIPSSDHLVKPLDFMAKHYWIVIRNSRNEVLYRSPMTRYVEIPARNKSHYTVKKTVARSLIDLHQDEDNEVTFRVLLTSLPLGDAVYRIELAKPVENLDEEIMQLVNAIAFGMLAALLLLVLISYLLAGRILRPIAVINRLSKEISEKTLDRRIPLTANEDELHVLTRSLNRMFDRLQLSFGQQKRFVADAAHELKSPLTLLLIFLEEAVHRPDIPDDLREGLSRRVETVRRMSRLVKGLLDLSALELTQKVNGEEVDLSALAREVVEDFRDFWQTRSIRVSIDLPERMPICGDRERLRRALINLLDNAIKYNRPGGEIRLGGKDEGRILRLTVYNTGEGMPQQECRNVFEQFYRVGKSRCLRYGGSGLGLTIVKKIIDLHGGSIGIESEEGSWTQVWMILPKKPG